MLVILWNSLHAAQKAGLAKQQKTHLKQFKFDIRLKEKHKRDEKCPSWEQLPDLRKSADALTHSCSVDPMTLSREAEGRLDYEHHHALDFNSFNSLAFFSLYTVNTLDFVGYKTISSAKADFALHRHRVQALLFLVFTFFLHPISFPLPSLISTLFVSSSLLFYIYSTSPISCILTP